MSHPHTSLRVGGWLPHRPTAIRNYAARLIAEDKDRPRKLLPPVKALADLIARDKQIGFLAQRMIDQVPAKNPKIGLVAVVPIGSA